MESPDLAGFREARERKRRAFSEPIVLLGPGHVVWPNVPLDPETGAPYDPTVEPIASGASAAIAAEFVWRSSQDPSDDSAAGTFDRSHPMLICGSGASAVASAMTHFVARGERFQIEAVHFDGITGIDRMLIYGART